MVKWFAILTSLAQAGQGGESSAPCQEPCEAEKKTRYEWVKKDRSDSIMAKDLISGRALRVEKTKPQVSFIKKP